MTVVYFSLFSFLLFIHIVVFHVFSLVLFGFIGFQFAVLFAFRAAAISPWD